MNFSQLQERLRLELLRRINQQALSRTLLAQKSGLAQPHISNILNNNRGFSMEAADRILAALELSVADLIDTPDTRIRLPEIGIPLVTADSAIFDDYIRPSAALDRIQLLPSEVVRLRSEHGARQPRRDRFVAVGLTPAQAAPMAPVLHPNSIVVLDRHSNLPTPSSPLRNIYAVRADTRLLFCYLSYEANFFILRPHSLDHPVGLLPVPPRSAPSDFVIGRVCYILSSL